MNHPTDPDGTSSTPTEPNETIQTSPESAPAPAIPWGWVRALLLLPFWLLGTVVAGLIAYFGLGITDIDDLMAMTGTPIDIAIIGLQLIFALLAVYLFRKLIDRRSFCSLGFQFTRPYRRDLLIGMAMGIGLIGLVFAILLMTGNIAIIDIQPPGSAFAIAVVVMIMVGITEELVMRGYIQGNLATSVNKYAALLITSILFAVAHLFNPNASLLGMVNILLAGLLLGIYYVHKQNLWLPIGMHFTWNLFQGSVFGSPVSGVSVISVIKYDVVGSELITGGAFGFEASIVTSGVMLAAIAVLHLSYRAKDGPSKAQLL